MRTYEFGDRHKPVVLLLPGTCCHWKNNFFNVIPYLERYFYVVCISYDGFDENEEATFPTMLEETEIIESYVKKRFQGHVCCIYGCSLGGSLVGLLAQRHQISFEHGILGSSDLDQEKPLHAKISCSIATLFLHAALQGKFDMTARLLKKATKSDYLEKMLSFFGIDGDKKDFISKKSIYNQAYSDLITSLEDQIEQNGLTVHCFYAQKMGKKYLERYKKHFKSPDIRKHCLKHEELLACYPKLWSEEVARCCGF